MINYARTLLLNQAGPHVPDPDVINDVFIPAYCPVTLSSALQSLRQVLFGKSPDYQGLLQRMEMYMCLLHAGGYAAYLFENDSRITYDPLKNSSFYLPYGCTVTAAPVYSPGSVTFETLDGTDFDGRAMLNWGVVANSTDTVLVTTLHDNRTTQQAATFGGNLSSPVKLPGSNAALRITCQDGHLYAGQAWTVSMLRRVRPDLAGVLAAVPTAALAELFEGSENEPVKTFRNLFFQASMFHQRMSGLLLALIHVTGKLQRGQ